MIQRLFSAAEINTVSVWVWGHFVSHESERNKKSLIFPTDITMSCFAFQKLPTKISASEWEDIRASLRYSCVIIPTDSNSKHGDHKPDQDLIKQTRLAPQVKTGDLMSQLFNPYSDCFPNLGSIFIFSEVLMTHRCKSFAPAAAKLLLQWLQINPDLRLFLATGWLWLNLNHWRLFLKKSRCLFSNQKTTLYW